MMQNQSSEKLVETLLQTINPSEIADSSWRQTVEILLNLIEQLQTQVKELREENQRLRDENNHLRAVSINSILILVKYDKMSVQLTMCKRTPPSVPVHKRGGAR